MQAPDNGAIAWIAFILYLFNPFTAGYVGGSPLSEVGDSVFGYIDQRTAHPLFPKEINGVVSLTALLGFLPQVRPVFILVSVITAVIAVWVYLPRLKKVQKKSSYGRFR